MFAIDNVNSRVVIVTERILPDKQHHHTVLPRLDTFWRLCILPEILRHWYTRRCSAPDVKPVVEAISFCRKPADNDVIPTIMWNVPMYNFTPLVCLLVQLQYQSYGTVHTVVSCPSSSKRECSNQNNLQPVKLLFHEM